MQRQNLKKMIPFFAFMFFALSFCTHENKYAHADTKDPASQKKPLPTTPNQDFESMPQTTAEVSPTISPTKSTVPSSNTKSVYENCVDSFKKLNLKAKWKGLDLLCRNAKELTGCTSVEGNRIFYFERQGDPKAKGNEKGSQKILSFSLIHGDEEESAAVSLAWIDRLNTIAPRNSWRVVPILNPDGWAKKTRTNANGVDVNRNFPSKDWHETALKYWRSETNENARRFPGAEPASEPETKCAMAQIDDFKPDFIISVHTPLGVLDFDGPKVSAPAFTPLPWVSLGNFPGSLGRYMWIDRGVPVLTVELKHDGFKHLEEFDRLQDATGTVAIQAEKLLKKKKAAEINSEKKPSS